MKYINLIIILLIISSCASYSKKEFRDDLVELDGTNLSALNGKYEALPFYQFGEQTDWNKEDSLRTREYIGVYEQIQNKSMQYDYPTVLDYDYVNLNFSPNGKLKYDLISNNMVIKRDSLDFKLKNGMVKLKNSFYKCKGLPFLFGGCRNGRVRVGFSKNNNLIINKSYDQYGAILIVIAAGVNHNTSYEYRKVKQD